MYKVVAFKNLLFNSYSFLLIFLVCAGLFDYSAKSDFIGKEIVKCINLAKDGIHAVLVVFSTELAFHKKKNLQSLACKLCLEVKSLTI